jgi:para-nitrobenzyl esterase
VNLGYLLQRKSSRRKAVATTVAMAAMAAAAVLAWSLASGSAVAQGATAALPAGCSAGTSVTTNTGPVCGTSQIGFNQWLGIPYAAPPVGNLRWKSPQAHAKWTTPLAAVNQVPGCPGSGTTTASEDCLQLDITTPTGANVPSTGRLPVIFYIHGGGFTGGTTSTYPEDTLAMSGPVVVVGIEYRLGVLGFLADDALGAHSGDYGLQDQKFAMRWVKKNIAQFGGDPSNITIMGSSAGASSVCDQIASPAAAGLFQKAISISGEYNSLFGAPTSLQPQDCKAQLATEQQAQATGATFAASVGCSTVANVAKCLRAVPVATLEAAQANGGTNSPIVNGTTLKEQPLESFATGNVNRVPAILGVNRDEDLTGTAQTPAAYTALVNSQYGPPFGTHAAQVLKRYPLARFPTPFIASRTVAADSNTVCPALTRDGLLSKAMPVYAFEGDVPDLPPYSTTSTTNPAGSMHDFEPGYLFPTAMGIPVLLDADQTTLRTEIDAQFTDFAATGSPNGNGLPTWPTYSQSSGNLVMSLEAAGDDQLLSKAAISFDHQCGFWNKISPAPQPN